MAEQIKLAPRVRYDDDEIGRIGREREFYRNDRHLSRQSSVGSLSIHSAGGGTRNVDPGTALPITYRTLSIEVDEGLQRKQEATKKAKEKGIVGMRRCHSRSFYN
jgi:sodium/potassium-transporting ATPase subunit alpha